MFEGGFIFYERCRDYGIAYMNAAFIKEFLVEHGEEDRYTVRKALDLNTILCNLPRLRRNCAN